MCRGGNEDGVLGGLALVEGLIAEEEKGAVLAFVDMRNADRAAYGGAELVLPEGVAGCLEVVAGIHLLVAEELPTGAVEGVGAGLGSHVNDAANDAAELGEIVMRLNLELLDVVDNWRVVVVADKGEIVDAVKQEHVAAVALSAD